MCSSACTSTCTTEIYGHCMWSSAYTTEDMGGTYIVHVQLETVLVAIIRRPIQYPKFAQLLVVRV